MDRVLTEKAAVESADFDDQFQFLQTKSMVKLEKSPHCAHCIPKLARFTVIRVCLGDRDSCSRSVHWHVAPTQMSQRVRLTRTINIVMARASRFNLKSQVSVGRS